MPTRGKISTKLRWRSDVNKLSDRIADAEAAILYSGLGSCSTHLKTAAKSGKVWTMRCASFHAYVAH